MPGILPRLPPGWKVSRRVVVERLYSLVVADGFERRGMRRLHVLYANSIRVARDTSLNMVLEALENELQRYTATAKSEMTFLTEGVEVWRGRYIIVPGCMHRG